ncbi:bifunctional methylenetetrahydrofolate dehydrogenase/methenyltetrahydrofolate cyclohydrolase FolD [Candidatus Nitronereus thalassa]|uniref:Bifunctional protein FolD n=1 Tax=Candidatus Nitronereus thalassa TaxID=3020898 RepID=A0ABU3K7G4_9BACT|nr:bifunctional methylenetetrahydrofolate dehydrogenase/methenyltetrahydrofolate cyclohydrolase FolD [Candidatus Nitronereus thalassa]MDT7042321.1 bifunctional methylenetetrahydrofolate dehydrogenase/methenyltetrahydrofolate cyclohydrolase FolD [Candidatus Nitronereus thalassa]
MSAQLIDGKALAQEIRNGIGKDVEALVEKTGVRPGLAVVLVGDDPASAVYVRNKKKACDTAGLHVADYALASTTKQEDLLHLITQLNTDPKIHGILVQLPLPSHIDSQEVLNAVSPEKDADGFHPYNIGRLVEGNPLFVPCTPKGVIRMIESTGQAIEGKRAVVLGRSNIVGKPVAMLLMHRHATVTICHSRTKDLPGMCREADILVAAIGKAQFVKGDMVKSGAIVIDVGINRLDDGRLVGDVDFDQVKERAGWLSPVPGGVGPMTIAMLLANTVEAAQRVAQR